MNTRERILAAALDLFGRRGFDGASLDDIAAVVGVRKQTLLYWFPSKDALVDGVLEMAADQLVVVVEAAIRAAPDEPLARVDAVVRAVFRPAVRRPALLGLVREVSRLPSERADAIAAKLRPLIDRATVYLGQEMESGRVRQGDPRLIAGIAYATVTGVATEPEMLRAIGWTPSAAGLRHLRDELRAYLRAALTP